jgi:hypothetical protein
LLDQYGVDIGPDELIHQVPYLSIELIVLQLVTEALPLPKGPGIRAALQHKPGRHGIDMSQVHIALMQAHEPHMGSYAGGKEMRKSWVNP